MLVIFAFVVGAVVVVSAFVSFSAVEICSVVSLLAEKELVSVFLFTSLLLTEQPTNTLINITATIHKITDFFIKHSSFAFNANLTDFGNFGKGAFIKSYTSFLYLIYKALSFLQVYMFIRGVRGGIEITYSCYLLSLSALLFRNLL